MKTKSWISRSLLLFAIVLTLSLAATSIAWAGLVDPETQCADNGGSWDGADISESICTYPEGNAVTISACGTGFILEWVFNLDAGTDYQDCIPVPVESGPTPAKIPSCESRLENTNPNPVELALCFGYNGTTNFETEACQENCLVGFTLPSEAAKNLPDDALATLYVMVRDADGNPTNDTYTVCFENTNGELLTIYRFVSGAWSAQVTSNGDPICATASGDGAFYLGGAD